MTLGVLSSPGLSAVRMTAICALAAITVFLASPVFAAEGRPHRHDAGRSPSGPPLTKGSAAGLENGEPVAGGKGEQNAGIASAAGDQLVENGLGSPLCKGSIAGQLSSAAQADCRTSDFVAAPAPTNDYALDVHIDTGAVGLSKGGMLSVVQDLLIAPAWGALEWLVRALVVMLEWCYTLELLGGSTTSAVASALAHARSGFTDPWLALVLALASLLALYHGLVRRRVADTLGGAVTMLAMMAGGLWVMADPGGTVGAVGSWANQASLGTLSTTAGGNTADAAATLGDAMRSLYAGVIEAPWCYLEFGNVRWCADPSQLDPALRSAALALVAHEHGGQGAGARANGELVSDATTNGALFLAFPANEPARNSIKDERSLLWAICRSGDATKCRGSAATEAEFRTDGGTFPRLLGLLPIAIGVFGVAALFGLVALRLLTAAFLGLFLLLLAPFAVLAPAFGDGGRAIFAGWLTRLLGAITSKLLFSFVLGALLTMQRLLVALDALGWWAQWLLLSAFWWTAFLKRGQAVAVLRGASRIGGAHEHRREHASTPRGSPGSGVSMARPQGRSSAGRVERSLQTYGVVRHPMRWAQTQVNARIGSRPFPHEREPERREAKAPLLRRARGRLERASAFVKHPPVLNALTAGRWRSSRGDLLEGLAPGDRRGGASAAATADHRAPTAVPGRTISAAEPGQGGSASMPDHEATVSAPSQRMQARSAPRPPTSAGSPTATTGVVESSGGLQRAGSELAATPGGRGDFVFQTRSPRARARGKDFENTHTPPTTASATAGQDRERPVDAAEARSPVMEDARAVAERRKRQLGFDSK